MAWRPFAPAPTAMPKLSTPLVQERPVNDEPLRPSSQVSICFAVTTGTLRAFAEATMAAAWVSVEPSVWMFAVKAP